MLRMTYQEWVERGTRLFGADRSKWRFVCPSCGIRVTTADYESVGTPENSVAFSCIGRFVPVDQRASVAPAFAGGEQVTGGEAEGGLHVHRRWAGTAEPDACRGPETAGCGAPAFRVRGGLVTVFVDELSVWPRSTRVRTFKGRSRMRLTSHLTATSHPELLSFSERLGLTPDLELYHPTGPYFELTMELRGKALELGAVFLPLRLQVLRNVVGGPVRRLLDQPDVGRPGLDHTELDAIEAATAVNEEQEYLWSTDSLKRLRGAPGKGAQIQRQLLSEKLDRLSPAMRKRYT